jgi:hypothetical protein
MTLKDFRSPDGIPWRVGVQAPSSSNAMVVFYHPDGSTSRRDRYAWYNTLAPEARNVTARLKPADVLERLTPRDIALLYRRSFPISTPIPVPEAGKGT